MNEEFERMYTERKFDVKTLKQEARSCGIKDKSKLYSYLKSYLGLDRVSYKLDEYEKRIRNITEAIGY